MSTSAAVSRVTSKFFTSFRNEREEDCLLDTNLLEVCSPMRRAEADEVRFEALYSAYSPQVYAYLKRRADLASAQDGTAETFLVAWRRLGDVPDDGRALLWLYGVARRVLANQRRSRSRRGQLVDRLASLGVQPAASPETAVMRQFEDAELMDAVHRLPAAQQELLRLAAWEELPHADIAALLGCTPHAVDQRLYRITHRLAREMAPSGHKHDGNATPHSTSRGDLS